MRVAINSLTHEGAKIYYLRNVIHDYPDEKAIVILKNLAAALAEDSVNLIDDMVIPDVGAHWHATQLDIALMAGLASMERTREAWYKLIEKAGLKINQIYTYTASLRDSIIVRQGVANSMIKFLGPER
jgi:demethylsterigmatocystin 6-O-methyltransferase